MHNAFAGYSLGMHTTVQGLGLYALSFWIEADMLEEEAVFEEVALVSSLVALIGVAMTLFPMFKVLFWVYTSITDHMYNLKFSSKLRKLKATKSSFDASLDCGITFFDSAKFYGSRFSLGAMISETLLGRFIKERKERNPDVEVAVATKFAALPWRLGRQSVLASLEHSLGHLALTSVELYQLYCPGIWGNEGPFFCVC